MALALDGGGAVGSGAVVGGDSSAPLPQAAAASMTEIATIASLTRDQSAQRSKPA